MDFFKSVFTDPSPPSSPTATPSPPSTPSPQNPQTTPPSSWPFGSTLFQTLASKSESLIDNYYKDFQEFSSGLKNETSLIRRAVQDLPARLESGAAIAQVSLEAVGQAIDDVGSTVSDFIGKDLNFNSNSDGGDGNSDDKDLIFSGVSDKPYSRMEAVIRAVQCDVRTYCDEVEESGYDEWRSGFDVEEKREEIERLVEGNGVIKGVYDEVVPARVDDGTFWCRYFYRVDKVVRAEEARARIVKKAILGEEEEDLSWDFDDEDGGGGGGGGGDDGYESKIELKKGGEEKGKGVVENRDDLEEKKWDNEDVGVSGTKSDEENLGERLMYNEKEVSSDGKIGSDISIISSQRSSHAEEDLGWDEIEDIGSGDERKLSRQGSPSPMGNAIDLHKRLSSGEDEEELTWDIDDDDDDDDDETVKSRH